MSIKRFLLLRRRIDALLLALAMLLLSILISAGKALFGLLAVAGIVLAVLRPRLWRYAPPAFTATLAAYCCWSIGLSLLRGDGIDGNRLLSYALIELACVFLPLGLFFVRRPLDALVVGARLGVIALLVGSVAEFWMTGHRVGLGRNEAILGFIAAGAGLIARLEMANPPRFLPNGRWWLYLSLIPAVLSQTRAAWSIYPIIAVCDLLSVWRGTLAIRGGKAKIILATGVALAMLAAVPFGKILLDRGSVGLAEVEQYEETGVAIGSVDVRLAMWQAAYDVWRESPLIGIGHVGKMETVASHAGVNAANVGQYTHLHNLLVDEALNSGLIGMLLLLAVFAVFIMTVFRQSSSTVLRETSAVFVFLVFSYGSFHGVLLNEWMVVLIFGFMSVTLTDLRRRQLGGQAVPQHRPAAAMPLRTPSVGGA